MQIDWPSNAGAKEALALLEPLYEEFKGQASFADIIVLAGNVAVEKAGGPVLPFCPGRVDAEDGVTEQDLSPRTYYLDALVAALDNAKVRLHPVLCMLPKFPRMLLTLPCMRMANMHSVHFHLCG